MKNKIVLLLLITFLIVSLSWAEDVQKKTISGEVVNLDWVGSVICVRYYPDFDLNADEIIIKITGETTIHRGTNSITFSDILQSDQVTVTYYDDGVGGLKAIRIADLNLEAVMD